MRLHIGLVLLALPLAVSRPDLRPTLEFEVRSTIPAREVLLAVRTSEGRVEVTSGGPLRTEGQVAFVVTPARIRVTGEADVEIVADERGPWVHLRLEARRGTTEAWGTNLRVRFDGSRWWIHGAATRSQFGGRAI